MRSLASAVMVTLMVLVVGCESGPTVVDDQPGPSFEFAQTSGGSGPTPLEILDSLDYEVFQGTLSPNEAGIMSVTMTTWPKNCTFGINVPPGALPGGSPVTFSLSVPTYQSYLDHADYNGGQGLPLIIRLEPSNVNFLVPLTVMATYMPWTGATSSLDFNHWTAAPVYEYFGLASDYQQRNRVRITFEAPHFSDWEVEGDVPTQAQ